METKKISVKKVEEQKPKRAYRKRSVDEMELPIEKMRSSETDDSSTLLCQQMLNIVQQLRDSSSQNDSKVQKLEKENNALLQELNEVKMKYQAIACAFQEFQNVFANNSLDNVETV